MRYTQVIKINYPPPRSKRPQAKDQCRPSLDHRRLAEEVQRAAAEVPGERAVGYSHPADG